MLGGYWATLHAWEVRLWFTAFLIVGLAVTVLLIMAVWSPSVESPVLTDKDLEGIPGMKAPDRTWKGKAKIGS